MDNIMSYVCPDQDPFRAIADPGRRIMLDAMFAKECTVQEMTALLGISQPSVSQHLKVLKLANLVEERQQGRQRFYRTKPADLSQVVDWVGKYEAFWNQKLDALSAHLHKKIN
jgi:DNA-binding transcriptional ArsR family regulator